MNNFRKIIENLLSERFSSKDYIYSVKRSVGIGYELVVCIQHKQDKQHTKLLFTINNNLEINYKSNTLKLKPKNNNDLYDKIIINHYTNKNIINSDILNKVKYIIDTYKKVLSEIDLLL